jgi:hypothetical protein
VKRKERILLGLSVVTREVPPRVNKVCRK